MQQQQPIQHYNGSGDTETLANLYNQDVSNATSAMASAKKRVMAESAFQATDPSSHTVGVILNDDDEKNSALEHVTAISSSAEQSEPKRLKVTPIDNKINWRNVSSEEQLSKIVSIASEFTKTGEYVNITPNNKAYNAMFGENVNCGFSFQVQGPPQVCTTGVRSSDKFADQWSMLLASSEVTDLTQRLNNALDERGEAATHVDEVESFMEFMRLVQTYITKHLIQSGESILISGSKRVAEQNVKLVAKGGKPLVDSYKQTTFVTRGKNDPMCKAAYANGSYTDVDYAREVTPFIGSFLASYEEKQSLNVRFYSKKHNGAYVRPSVPDCVIINGETGQLEQFNPNALYCQKGRSSIAGVYKFSILFNDGQFRLYVHCSGFAYWENKGAGATQFTFTNANGQVVGL